PLARPGSPPDLVARAQRDVELPREPRLARDGRTGRAAARQRRRRDPRAGGEARQPRLLQEQYHPFLCDPVAADTRAARGGGARRDPRLRRLVARLLPLGIPASGARGAARRARTLARLLWRQRGARG